MILSTVVTKAKSRKSFPCRVSIRIHNTITYFCKNDNTTAMHRTVARLLVRCGAFTSIDSRTLLVKMVQRGLCSVYVLVVFDLTNDHSSQFYVTNDSGWPTHRRPDIASIQQSRVTRAVILMVHVHYQRQGSVMRLSSVMELDYGPIASTL